MSELNNVPRLSKRQFEKMMSVPEDRVRERAIKLAENIKSGYKWIVSASQDKSSFVRRQVAESLCSYSNRTARDTLIEILLNDPEPVVRAEAADSLSCFKLSESELCALLITLTTDPNIMVRSYAALALGASANPWVLPYIRRQLKRIKSEDIRVSLMSSAIELGDADLIHALLTHLDSDSYQIRCAVVNIISFLMTKLNPLILKEVILPKFEERLKVETTVAVRASLEREIATICQKLEIS